MKKFMKKIRSAIIMILTLMMSSVTVFATDPTKDDVITVYENNWFVINVITAILVVSAIIMIAFELIFHRKDTDKRAETMGSIPYVIGALAIVALALQIVTRMQF